MVVADDLKRPTPGPGEYTDQDAYEFIKDYRPENNKGMKVFIEDNHDRFGDNPDYHMIQVPGPGSYEIQEGGKEFKERALVSGAVFLSESERTPFGRLRNTVAPNKYNPSKIPPKISFHFNVETKWV